MEITTKDINRLITLWMGEEYTGQDFSRPDHFARLTGKLFKQEELWDEFCEGYAHGVWEKERKIDFYPWLLSPDDQLRYTRFVTLFAEFLRLPETVEEFGREEICSEFNRWHNPCPPFCDKCDDGSGKVLSAWAREEVSK
jgi:hypothetical protein